MEQTRHKGRDAGSLVLLLLLLTGLLVGCGKEDAPESAVPKEVTPAGGGESSAAAGKGAPDLSVRILPEQPTALDDLQIIVSGADGPIQCRWQRNGQEISPEDPNCLPEGNFRKGDLIEVTVNSAGETARTEMTVGNTPPEVIRVPFENPEVHQGVDIRVAPEGVDRDGDPVSFRYEWKINGEEYPWVDGPVLTSDRFAKGDRVSLTVIPFDGEAEGEPYPGGDFTIPNAPPRFVSQPPSQFRSGIYRYRAQAEDPDGKSLTYRLEESPPAMSVDPASGEVVWAIGEADAGSHTVRIVAEDEEGMTAAQEYTIDIAISSGE